MTNETNYPSVNIISEGSELEGFLKSEHDIRIGGILNGTLETQSKVIITEQGYVSGDIVCQNADIAGKVSGDVLGKNKVTLRKKAVLDGNVTAKILVVEEGAKVNGLCKMGDSSVVDTQEFAETMLHDVEK
mgnify:FL=1|jgi:cytoskeletal protein CcmA (bactofilin family)